MTISELTCALNMHTDSNDTNYTKNLRNLVYSIYDAEIENNLFSIIDNNRNALHLRYNAYYSLFIYYRRKEFTEKYCLLFEQYNYHFESIPLNLINKAFYYRYCSIKEPQLLITAIDCARKATEVIANNPGVFQTYAELVVVALDKEISITDSVISHAIEMINQAVYRDREYAKYYCTKGRLYYYIGKYKEACTLIEKAIDLEKLNDNDSVLRTSQYYFYLLEIKSKEMHKKLDEKLIMNSNILNQILDENNIKANSIFEALDKVKSKYLEFLAFFASIMAFIISTINIVGKFAVFKEAAALLLILGGVLSMSFCLFSLLIDYNSNKIYFKRSVTIFIISLIIIALGYIVGMYEF